MNNFAIFTTEVIGENKGGPSGYIFNLTKGLNMCNIEYTLISNTIVESKSISNNNKRKITSIRSILYTVKKGLTTRKIFKDSISEFTIVHCHSCEDVWYLRKFLKFKGEIILTSHRPEPLADERITGIQLSNQENKKFKLLRLFLNYIEKFGYKKSNFFIFPSPGAHSIYTTFPGFMKYSINKKVYYVYTGVENKYIDRSITRIKEDFGLPLNNRVITYIGRHNYIKGYDMLKDSIDEIISDDFVMVCAGANNLITSPKHEQWYELGLIKNVNELISISDFVVIPNRNTYFDLIIIEVLSQGKIVLTSNTGGNIDLANNSKGVVLFEKGSIKSLKEKIKEVKSYDVTVKNDLENQNFNFYNEYCSLEKFAINYIKIIDLIADKVEENNRHV
jgi:glycosyltransferase involved in cell wall biosynthesis